MNLPLVSIICPTYNQSRYLPECIESVLCQSYSHWELIIVDDCSTDDTEDIVKEYQLKDNRIKYLKTPHYGAAQLSRVYNAGLMQSKGELIAILEGDDFWPPDKLSIQVDDFQEPHVVLSYGNWYTTDPLGTPVVFHDLGTLPTGTLLNEPVGQSTAHMILGHGSAFTYACTIVIRRTALDKIGGFLQYEDTPVVDQPTFLTLSLEGQFRYHKHLLGFWRRHLSSISNSKAMEVCIGCEQFSRSFYNEHNETLRKLVDIEELQKSWKNSRCRVSRTSGRIAAAHGQWGAALMEYRRAIYEAASFRDLMTSIAMYVMVRLHINTDKVIGIMPGRPSVMTFYD